MQWNLDSALNVRGQAPTLQAILLPCERMGTSMGFKPLPSSPIESTGLLQNPVEATVLLHLKVKIP